ncbi:hypothetical protein CDD82_6275 [Ophiocordyceps australis]|uniref:ATP-grasp domain-containing protein n=1 Tax=Ophiocordyceps australis TaxID=1399860 RepID=A0A2C5YXY9_9HYPO|nr:hypothetical protein CDD82_6275 [Ophiocordyceps australis]
MRICLINSSYEGTGSPFEAASYDPLPDPSRYIPKTRHEFICKFVTKANAKAEIDEICKEKYDFFFNYMWGVESDNVAGLDATLHLESKGIPILAQPSSFLSLTKLHLAKAAELKGLRMPQNTPGKYPKIVKYAASCGSLGLDYHSVCHDEMAVKRRVAHLQQVGNTPLLVSDFIIGAEASAMVIETGRDVVALTPLKYVFPQGTRPDQAFLTWHNKFEACKDGTITYAFAEGTEKTRLQKAAVDAFRALEIQGAAWARVDMRLERGTNKIYVLEVNSIPAVFYPKGNKLGDDLVVEETFPGAHLALMDMLLATKMIQLGLHKDKAKLLAAHYDKFAPSYDGNWRASGLCKVQQFLARTFDFGGEILDLACGTGAVGRVLNEAGIEAEITGIEVSEGMLQCSADIYRYYKQPIIIGPMEEEIMVSRRVTQEKPSDVGQAAGQYDHIVCFGALHFLQPVMFNAVLAKMFMLARKSVSFEIDDMPRSYTDFLLNLCGQLFMNYNHVQAIEQFGVPKGWELVHRSHEFLFTSPHTGHDIFGYAFRFERLPKKRLRFKDAGCWP